MNQRKVNYREVLVKRLSNLESCFVLDAGTGAGSMTKILSDQLILHVVSADVNTRVFPSVRARVNKRKVDFIACDFASLPFKDESLCGIICDLVISTSEDWRPLPTYVEFKRTLLTKGILCITDYYPEDTPRNTEEKLAAKTWRFYREVSKALGAKVRRDFPPEKTMSDLTTVGFNSVRKRRMTANEDARWKKRVFIEYYNGMKNMISSLSSPRLNVTFGTKLEALKSDIIKGKEVRWGWGVNYLIEAQK